MTRCYRTCMEKELFNQFGWELTMEEASLPDGRKKKLVRVHRCDSVHILAFDKDCNVLLLREFRPFYGKYIWMLPSGRVDKENDIETAAQRELQEETGFRSKSLTHYCTTQHSESMNFANHIFIAKDLTEDPLKQDDHELIEVHAMPLEEAIEKVLSSPVIHTASAFALLRYTHEHP